MTPTFSIWVGINNNNKTISPSELLDLLHDKHRNSLVDDITANGYKLDMVYSGNEFVGFGVEIFQTGGHYGAVLFNMDTLKNIEERARAVLGKLFEKWGLEVEIDTWCVTDLW